MPKRSSMFASDCAEDRLLAIARLVQANDEAVADEAGVECRPCSDAMSFSRVAPVAGSWAAPMVRPATSAARALEDGAVDRSHGQKILFRRRIGIRASGCLDGAPPEVANAQPSIEGEGRRCRGHVGDADDPLSTMICWSPLISISCTPWTTGRRWAAPRPHARSAPP